jgi:hypothetical protein
MLFLLRMLHLNMKQYYPLYDKGQSNYYIEIITNSI